MTYFLTYGGKGAFDIGLLSQGTFTMVPVIVGGGLYLIYFFNKLLDISKPDKAKPGSKNKEGKEVSQFFDSRWITEKELKTEKKFMFTTWSSIGNSKDGILLRSELKKNNLEINMYKPIHALIIGTTGTGKTQKYITS